MITVTTDAAVQLKQIMENQSLTDVSVRVFARGQCGCGKIHFGMGFDDKVATEDQAMESEGVKLLFDEKVAPSLTEATIDFIETEAGQGFTINTPNAPGCSCGQ